MKGELIAVGLNYRSAPVELRERLAVPEHEQIATVRRLVQEHGLHEAALLSTCNRVELYAVCDEGVRAGERALRSLARWHGVPDEVVVGHAFMRAAGDAARHIFRVTASLDSMVVGEPQILGQVKDAVQRARDAGAVGPVLDRAFNMAFKGAKRVRTETEVARGAASVPSVAVELAQSIFGELRGCAVMIVGAGEMAQQAAVHLRAAGVSEIVVVNRSAERGQALAREVEGHYEPMARLADELPRVDIVVTSTGSPQPIIDRALLKGVMRTRRQRPLFLVDIAVPRDVSPDAGQLDHVFLYNVDDLQGIVHDNLRQRHGEAELAESLVDEEVRAFAQWQRTRAVGPLIGALQRHGKDVVDHELARLLPRLADLSAAQRALVEQFGHAIAKKLLHQPTAALRSASADPEPGAPDLAGAVAQLFQLPAAPTPGPTLDGSLTSVTPSPEVEPTP